MAYSLRVASCFLFCAAAIQDVVHVQRKASQLEKADQNIPVWASTDAKINNAMTALETAVTEEDAKVKSKPAGHAPLLIKDSDADGNPDGVPLNAELQAAELLVNDTVQEFHAGVATLETQVTKALTDLSAEGLATARTALAEVGGALEPLRQAEKALEATEEALAAAAGMDALSVQAPLQEAVDAATQTMSNLTQETKTYGPWISKAFDAVLDEAGAMPIQGGFTPEAFETLKQKTRKAAADSTKLVKDMETLAVTPLLEVTKNKDINWALGHPGEAMPSAAEGSRLLSAAVGGVVLMALTAATA